MNHTNYIRTLFEATRNGMLTLTHSPEDSSEEFERTYPVDWDEPKVTALEKQFEVLRNQLDRIGLLHEALQAAHTPDGILEEDLLPAWNTYIAPFGPSGLDEAAVAEADMKRFLREKLTGAEEALLKAHEAWYEQQCLKRLPCAGCCPARLINRARRYEKLVSLRAPEIILENEARCLAEEMVLYHCMKP